jgi:hypothetical protein
MPSYGWYDKNIGDQYPADTGFAPTQIPIMSTFWSTNSAFCNIVDWNFAMDDGFGGYTLTTDHGWLTNNPNNGNSLLNVRTNPDTPVAGVKRYIEVTTRGGLKAYQPFMLYVCGQETITHSMTTIPFYYYLYAMQNGVVNTLPNEGDVRPNFNNDNT